MVVFKRYASEGKSFTMYAFQDYRSIVMCQIPQP